MITRRRPRCCVVVLAGVARTGEGAAQALTLSLEGLGIDARSLGLVESARSIALAVADARPRRSSSASGAAGSRFCVRFCASSRGSVAVT
jgi:hypothetical protein